MKHFSFLTVGVFSLLLFAACSYDEETVQYNEIEQIVISADNFETTTDSRTILNATNEGVEFAWVENDTVGIFPTTGAQVYFPMISGAGTKSATFTGGGWALKRASAYAAYYPFIGDFYLNQKEIPVSYVGQKQDGNASTNHLGAYDYMAATATTPTEGNVSFQFKHLGAIVRLKLIIPQAVTVTSIALNTSEESFIRRGEIDLTSNQISITPVQKSKSLFLELSNIETKSAGEEITAYMMIPPVDLTGKEFYVSVTDDTGNVASAKLDSKNFEAGKAYALSASLEAFETAGIQIADTRVKAIGAEGGELVFEYMSNVECQVIIPEDAQNWISPITSRAMSKNTSNFIVSENTEEANRNVTVMVKSLVSNLAVEYKIIQGGINSYAITEENGRLPIGVLTAQYPSTNNEHDLSTLIDDDLNTFYEVAQSSFNIVWEGPDVVAVNCFGFGLAYSGINHPADVTISMSTDGNGNTWNGIGWSWIPGSEDGAYFVPFDNTTLKFKYYRLEVKSNHGGTTTQFAEFYMGVDTLSNADIITFEDLVNRGSSFTNSESTPMGTHYADKHVTTDADRIWLSTATNEPDLLESASNYTLRPYTVTLYPFGEPVPADINQHGVGDCSALAVMAEMAYLFPDFIKSIIVDNGDTTYTVAMYDPQGNPVNVTVQSTFLGDDNGIGATSGKNGEANWATIMEKAIMKWNHIYQVNPDISGIGSEHVAPLFTGEGNSFAFSPNLLSASQLKQAVDVALDNRMIVIGGFSQGNVDVGYGPQTVTAHAFSFMKSTDSDAMFSMRNPWGNSPGGTSTDDGVLNIFDDNVVSPLIDLRIIYPGVALNYAVKELSPYIPPQY